jgi:hypothetical protein
MMEMIESLDRAVFGAKVEGEPYEHFYMTKVFSPEFYEQMRANLPDVEHYEPYYRYDAVRKDGTTTRYRLPLTRSSVANLPVEQREFWLSVMATIYSPQLRGYIFSKLATSLTKRFGAANPPAFPCSFLYRDMVDYSIDPHPDSRRKAVTVQFYLPPDDDHAHYGTSLMSRRAKQFKTVKKFEYKRNTGYAFTVTKKSWHGVDRLEEEGYDRDTLFLAYYLREKSIWGKSKWGADGQYIPD